MKLGIDLGTRNSLVFVPKKGVVLQEPSVVAVDLDENKILAVGRDANEMIGRAPDTIRVYRPMREGVIADFCVTQAMIRYFINKASGKFRFWPEDEAAAKRFEAHELQVLLAAGNPETVHAAPAWRRVSPAE